MNDISKYSFEGDTSSLDTAVSKAIDLLGRYASKISEISDVAKSGAGFNSLRESFAQVAGELRSLLELSQKLGNFNLSKGSVEADALKSSLSSLTDLLTRAGEGSRLTQNDFISMAKILQGVTSNFSTAKGAIGAFGTDITAWSQQTDALGSGLKFLGASVSSTSSAFAPLTASLLSSASGLSSNSTAAREASNSFGTLLSSVQSSTSSFSNSSQAARGASSATEAYGTQAARAGVSTRGLGLGLGNLSNYFKKVNTSSKKLTQNINILNKSSDILKQTFRALTGLSLANVLANAIKESISYIENLNLFTVAMGESVAAGKEFVNQMQELYGLDPNNILRFVGNFHQLSSAIEAPADAARIMSLGLTKSGTDLSSLFNVPIENVMADLSSGMQGMTRAVRKYGLDLRVTTLQQTALSLGMSGTVATMSEANRQGLRYITILKQSKNAMGDFAKTIETPANQLKIFKEQITQLGRAIGNFAINSLSKVLPYINGFTMALREALVAIAVFVGFSEIDLGGPAVQAENISDAFDDVAESVDKTTKKLKKMLLPFDEINKLGSPETELDASEIMDSKVLEAIKQMELAFENIRMKANDVRDSLLDFFGFTKGLDGKFTWNSKDFEENLIEKFPKWTKIIQSTFANWSNIVKGFKNLVSSLVGVAKNIGKNLSKMFGSSDWDTSGADFIETLGVNLNRLSDWISDNSQHIASLAIVTGGVALAFKGWGVISSLVGSLSALSPLLSALVSPAGLVALAVVAVAGSFVLLYNKSEEFAENTDLLWESVSGTISDFVDSTVSVFSDMWTRVQETWDEYGQPFVDNLKEVITKLSESVRILWDKFLGPVIERISKGFEKLWRETLGPTVQSIVESFLEIGNSAMEMWNEYLLPAVNWIVNKFGPPLVKVFDFLWTNVENIFGGIATTIEGLVRVLRGVTNFITGVFTGDWKKAWKGIKQIFEGIWNGLVGAFGTPINTLLSGIEIFINAIIKGWNALKKTINKFSLKIPSWLGGGTVGFNLEMSDSVKLPRLKALAEGAVVTGPTRALIGEGAYDEAVLPLGNSPQMKDLISEIAKAVKGNEQPLTINVYNSDGELTGHKIITAAERAQRRNGGALSIVTE